MLLWVCFAFSQFDTTNMLPNKWLNTGPAANGLSINGSNWAYENDLAGHPFLPFFVLGPGVEFRGQGKFVGHGVTSWVWLCNYWI